MPFKDATANMFIGDGIDTLSGEVRSKAVTATEFEDLTGQGGEAQEVLFRLERIQSLEELQESLGLSIEGSASFGLFGGSEKFKLQEESRFNRFSLFVKVQVRVVNAERRMKNPQLLPEARDLLANGNATGFRERFGDVFVRGLRTGGEFFAVLEIQTSNDQEVQAITNEAEASGAFGIGFDVKTKFIDFVSKAAQNHVLNVFSVQLGGAETTAQTQIEAIIDKAARFAASARDIAAKYQVDVASYKILDLPPQANFLDLQQQKETLQTVFRDRTILIERLNDIDFMLLNANQFTTPSINLNDVRRQVVDAVNQFTDAGSHCINVPTDCKQPNVKIPDLSGLPERLNGPRVTVPKLIGRSVTDAQFLVEGVGLRFESLAVQDENNINRVRTQDPAPISLVLPDSTVNVTFGGRFVDDHDHNLL